MGSVDINDVISCNTVKAFWISWAGNNLAVGTGVHVGTDELLRAENTGLDITTISVATPIASRGIWEFDTSFLDIPGGWRTNTTLLRF